MLDGAVVLLGLEIVDGDLFERVHRPLDDRLREEQHLPHPHGTHVTRGVGGASAGAIRDGLCSR